MRQFPQRAAAQIWTDSRSPADLSARWHVMACSAFLVAAGLIAALSYLMSALGAD